MPGLQQLTKFDTKILSLGDEPAVRLQSGEPRAKIVLPATASDVDDSDDFMFGLENFGKKPTEEKDDNDFLGDLLLDDAADSTDAEKSVEDDFFSSLPSIPDRVAQDTAEPSNEEANLDALFSGLQLPPDVPTPDTSAVEPDTSAVEPDLSDLPDLSDFSLTNESANASDVPTFEDLPGDTQKSAPSDFLVEEETDNLQDFSAPEDTNAADESLTPDYSDVSSNNTKTASPQLPTANFDFPADFDLLKDLDLPDGMNIPAEEPPQAVVLPPVEDANSDIPVQDSDLSALLGNVEELFETDFSDEGVAVDSTATADTDSESDDFLATSQTDESPALPSDDFAAPQDLPDFSGTFADEQDEAKTEESDTEILPDTDFGAFSADLPDLDFPALDSLPTLDDLQPESSTEAFSSFDNFDAQSTDEADFSVPDFTSGDSTGDDFSIPDIDIDFDDSAEKTETSGAFSDTLVDFDLPSVGEPTGSEKNVSSDTDGFEFETNFFHGDDDEKAAENAKAAEQEKTLPNQFTQDEYQRFLTNLHLYPLNLRMAIESLVVENQFTDETVSDLIRRVVKKTPARQLAAHISKLLDKTIQIPRDFEKRTATQYEQYKQSVEYQIKNRVLPVVFLSFAVVLVGSLLWIFGNKFVYLPIRAEIFYSQGYKLLQDGTFPQAEQKFNLAVEKNPVKNWFLKYASAYSSRKQFERARKTYDMGLRLFNNDKKIGLAYAKMELTDLANYERSEEIIKRNILDFYINDKDGLLLLGDVYLDWATEKDPTQFDAAREQYASLIELYGETDLYLSRMMRYFIRTDNLREVLPLKEYFFPKKKSLAAPDLVELSGYLLEKQYGKLSPADEYLRTYVEDVRALLERALQADNTNPLAHYNFGKYLINIASREGAKTHLSDALNAFTASTQARTRTLIAKNIDTYRLLGNLFANEKEYLQAEELYALGIRMLEKEQHVSSLAPDTLYGKLYADMGDINYFISSDMDRAYSDYQNAIAQQYDTPSVRYKIGYIQYSRKRYPEALGSFIKTAAEKPNDRNLLYALGNVLALRGDNFASHAYYEMLMTELNIERSQSGVLFPQVNPEQGDLVTLFMYTANNVGVTLFRLAQQTGDSGKNARAMVYFADSVRAWDALTRNQSTMVRLDAGNLAAQNLKYAAFPIPNFQPEIYTDIFRTMYGEPFLSHTPQEK